MGVQNLTELPGTEFPGDCESQIRTVTQTNTPQIRKKTLKENSKQSKSIQYPFPFSYLLLSFLLFSFLPSDLSPSSILYLSCTAERYGHFGHYPIVPYRTGKTESVTNTYSVYHFEDLKNCQFGSPSLMQAPTSVSVRKRRSKDGCLTCMCKLEISRVQPSGRSLI